MRVVSFFAGCGGLDLGFRQAGFDVVWANEFDKTIHATYRLNHPQTVLNTSDIRELSIEDIPDCDGFIGGPPCQSWSVGGSMKGLEDERGKLFVNYIHIIKEKKPKFFLIENVAGIISDRHFKTFRSFLSMLSGADYVVKYSVLNAADYGVPQDRIRVFIVGIQRDIGVDFLFPNPVTPQSQHISLRKAIGDIVVKPYFYDQDSVKHQQSEWNHDCYAGPYDKKYMARNRVRGWDEVSFTIQAQAKNVPIHPQAPPMVYISSEERQFDSRYLCLYRRLSIRECARIQTFPDGFRFIYDNILDGYKMVGNAVPPRLAKYLGFAIKEQLSHIEIRTESCESVRVLNGYCRTMEQFENTINSKLYYARAGFRRGALQLPIGQQLPEFILLHHACKMVLFKLSIQEPKLRRKEELEKKGFHPHGDIYYCFSLLNECDLSILDVDELQRKEICNTYSSRILLLKTTKNVNSV